MKAMAWERTQLNSLPGQRVLGPWFFYALPWLLPPYGKYSAYQNYSNIAEPLAC